MLPSRLFFDDSFFKGDESIKSDIYEKDGKLVVEMEAPGYTKEDIDISVDKGTLSITFEKNEEEEENKKYLHRERKSYSKVSRSFYLGDVNEEEIDASFKNGILVVSAPKKKEIESLRQELDRYRNMEVSLKDAIIRAEEAGDNIKKMAREESNMIIVDAKHNASRIVNEALLKAEKIEVKAETIENNMKIFKRKLKLIMEQQMAAVEEIEILKLDD